MTRVELDCVTKDYHLGHTVVHALSGVTLSIEASEFSAVWGPSGSGKTTLLNLIGIIDDATTGCLRFGGRDVAALSDDEKSALRNQAIGYVFQSFNLMPVLSALENVMLPLQLRGVSGRDAKKQSLHRLNQVGLDDCLDHRPDELSGGQRQRVSIARALVTRPAIIIADEPTANLDSDTAMHIIELLRALNREEKTTVLFSTHDGRLLSRVDRRIGLIDGRLGEGEAGA